MKLIDLLRPMLLLSLGLHVLLLLLPLGRTDETVVPADEAEATETEGKLFASQELASPEPEVSPAPIQSAAPPSAPAQVSPPRSQAPPTAMVVTPQQQHASQPSPNQTQPESPQPQAAAPENPVSDLSTPAAEATPAPTLQAAASAPEAPAAEPTAAPQQQAYVKPTVPEALEKLLDFFNQALSYDPAGTSDQATQAAKDEWTEASRVALAVEQLNVETLERPVRLNYPIENPQEIRRSLQACLPALPHSAEVGVLLDESGEATPTLLRSTGYSALDQEALALAKARMDNLENPEAPTAYILAVNVRYHSDSCASLAELTEPESDQLESRDRPQ